jgi:hypothetical protein
MLEPGGDFDLAEEAVGAEPGGEVGAQDLDGDPAVGFRSSARYTAPIPPCPSARSRR